MKLRISEPTDKHASKPGWSLTTCEWVNFEIAEAFNSSIGLKWMLLWDSPFDVFQQSTFISYNGILILKWLKKIENLFKAKKQNTRRNFKTHVSDKEIFHFSHFI